MSEQDDLRSLAKHLPPIHPPDSVWAAIEAELDRPPNSKPRFSPFFYLMRGRVAFAGLAAALAMAVALYWYDSRKPVAHWDVVRLDGAPSVGVKPISAQASIREGEWLETDAGSRAQIKVGDIG